MSILERVAQLRQVWSLFMKDVPAPPDDVLAGWATEYTPEELEHSIARTRRKMYNDPTMQAEDGYRYAAGVLRSERRSPQRPQRLS